MKEHHPLTEYIPERSDQGDLAWNIAESGGVHDPVVLYEGKVIEGRVRQRAAHEVGVWEPQYRDWVLLADGGDPLDWMVRKHVQDYGEQLSELDRIRLAAKVLAYYKTQIKGATHSRLSTSVGLSQRKVRAIDWIEQVGKLDKVLSGEKNLMDVGRELGLVAENRGVALGQNYGHGDKFDEATQPLVRYLSAWRRKGFEFRHVNPKEAQRRVKLLEDAAAGIADALVDLKPRSVRPRHTTPSESSKRSS